MEKVFCETCLSEESYYVTDEKKKEIIDGKEISYLMKNAYCDKCNTELYVEEVMKLNRTAYQDAIREVTGLIKVSEINDLLKKYNIGAKPLAKLLRWGEVSIVRYLNGAIPERIYSEKLKELLYHEDKMENLLFANKKLITPLAYRKCKAALKKIELVNENSKLYMTAKLITSFNPDITNLALQKLLYFIQGFSTALLNNPIFDDAPEVWPLGPVYPEIYHRYASYQSDSIDFDIEEFDIDNIQLFTSDEITLIFLIVKYFGEYSGSALANMTHNTTPWKNHIVGNNEPITLEELKQYFTKVKKKYHITYTDEAALQNYILDIKK